MPTYEYRCNACKREFEYEQRMSDDDLVTCEICGEPKLERLISRTAFQLKGSGWYKDLYSSSKPAEHAKPAGEGGAEAAKTETAKPAAETPKSETPAPAPKKDPGTGTGAAKGTDK